MTKHLLLVFLTLLIAACNTPHTQKMPEWINGNSQRYSTALYLTGRGSGDNAQDAKDRARSDLAKQFEVIIDESSQQSQAFVSTEVKGHEKHSLDQSVSRQLNTYTTRNLSGVEIAEQWQSPETNTYHALAVLSRDRAQRQFEQEIAAYDDASRSDIQRAQSEKSNLLKAALLQRALNNQQLRSGVQRSLQVVDSSGRGRPSLYSLSTLKQSRDALLKQVSVQAITSEGEVSELQKLLTAVLAETGFKSGDNQSSDYQVTALLINDPIEEERGWYWLRGTLQITLLDALGHELGVQRWPLKVSATTEKRAQQRMLSEASTTLKQNLRDSLLGFVLDQD